MKLLKRKYITKVRYPTYSYNGHLQIRYCTNCRIKDGATTGSLVFGVCSFCGRKSRVYTASPWNYPTIVPNSNHQRAWGYWRRTDTWKDHRL